MRSQGFLVSAVLIGWWAASQAVHGGAPLGSGFTYQGRLKQGGSAVNGATDLQFSLWDAAANGSQIGMTQALSAVPVNEGLFAVEINAGGEFGLPAFNGEARWLEIAIAHPSGSGNHTPLSPRQLLTAAPYAHFALSADKLDGLDSTAFLQSIPVPLTLSGTNPGSHIISGANTSTTNNSYGVHGWSSGIFGETYGVYGRSESTGGRGVYGYASVTSGTTYAVYGQSDSSAATAYGVWAQGRIGASGTKLFCIDHSNDPENKYLMHYSAESPEKGMDCHENCVVPLTDGPNRTRPQYKGD